MPSPDLFTPVVDDRPADRAWPEMAWPPTATDLSGAVVNLRRVDPERDAEELFAALDDDRVWAHLPERPRDADAFARMLAANDESPAWATWVVRLQRDLGGLSAGTAVGTTSYLDASAKDARLEIGFTAYRPEVWASAVNPDAKSLLLGHAFDVLGAGRVQFKTDVRNERSQRAIARLGARYEGTLRRHMRRPDGTVRDSVLFSVIAEEWPAVREGLALRVRG